MKIWICLGNKSNSEYSKFIKEMDNFKLSFSDFQYEIFYNLDLKSICDYYEKSNSKPNGIFFSTVDDTLDLASRLSIKLNASLFQNCIGLEIVDNQLVFLRPVYDNSFLSYEKCNGLQIATFRFNSNETISSWSSNIPIDNANIIVCVGRGIADEKGIKLAQDFAKSLNAAIGATRAVTDMGILPISKQIGQTGKYVTPSIYIGIGVAGAIQHMSGMRNSDIIIAINKDGRAPLFKYADYGIIGDAYEILPMLTRKINNM